MESRFKNRIIGYGEEQVDQIMFNPKNWRIHTKSQQDALTGVLEEIGWVQNVIVNKRTGHLVDGHLRVQLADRAGEKTIPVTYVDLSESEEMTVLATIDPIAAMAATDKEKLDDVLRQVHADDARIQKAIADLAANEGLYKTEDGKDTDPQIDKAEELRVKWGVESGQLWEMGEHRIICGDCTKIEDANLCLGGDIPFLMVTDPPYGVNYDGGAANYKKREMLIGDNNQDLFKASLLVAAKIMNDGAWYIWHSGRFAEPVYTAISQNGWDVRSLLIWNKINPHYGAPMAHYCQKHEPCLYAVKHNANFIGPSNECTVWDIEQPKINEYHPTQKPLECMARPIRNHSSDYVYEPFSGSGTTIIACENLGRKCRAIEIDPGYVAVALERWHQHTGKTPKLIS
jgi:DNA modification methylase